MSERARPRGILVLAFCAGLVLAIGVGYARHRSAGSEASAPVPPAPAAAAPAPAPIEPAVPAAAAADVHPVGPSQTLELDRAAFPASGPVRVSLQFPVPSANAEPYPVQVFSMSDDRVFDTQGRLDGDRTAATIDLDPGWLRPGTYLVQVKTTEPSVFPLRRYVIEVR